MADLREYNMAEKTKIKKTKPIRKQVDPNAKYHKDVLNLLQGMADKLEFICADIKRQRGG